ncbi:MAG TPA: glycosyl hydrolase family 18 protein [Longimicrobiales bacterium]
MTKTLLASLTILLLASPLSAQQRERLFYYVDQEPSWNSLVRNIERIDVIAPSAYFVDEDGIVWGGVDPRVLELARRHDVRVVPLLVNRGFDQAELHELLVDDAARRRVIDALVELCRRRGYDGIQIDFENLSIHDRDAFTRFYREAAEALHGAGFRISIAVVHRPDELAGATAYQEWLMDSWRGGYDLAALAAAGDFISVMTYSQHTRRTPPGPQASVPWMEDVIAYFLEFVPPQKLSLGIATGSQHWYTSYEERITPELARSYSAQLSHAWALGMIQRNGGELHWSDRHQVTYSFFPVGGTFEWIFLEDARSFRARLALVEKHELRGFSVWVLGPEDPEIWEALPAR